MNIIGVFAWIMTAVLFYHSDSAAVWSLAIAVMMFRLADWFKEKQ